MAFSQRLTELQYLGKSRMALLVRIFIIQSTGVPRHHHAAISLSPWVIGSDRWASYFEGLLTGLLLHLQTVHTTSTTGWRDIGQVTIDKVKLPDVTLPKVFDFT
jgi:hypothetical protein